MDFTQPDTAELIKTSWYVSTISRNTDNYVALLKWNENCLILTRSASFNVIICKIQERNKEKYMSKHEIRNCILWGIK